MAFNTHPGSGKSLFAGFATSLTGTSGDKNNRTGYTKITGSGGGTLNGTYSRFNFYNLSGYNVFSRSSSAYINDCLIYNYSSGAAYIYGGNGINFENTVYDGNRALIYGGSSYDNFTGCTFYGSSASNDYNGVLIEGSFGRIERCKFDYQCPSGTGYSIVSDATIISNCLFINCSVGTGRYIVSGSSIVNSTFSNCSGGLATVSIPSGEKISNSIVYGNTHSGDPHIVGASDDCVEYCDVEDLATTGLSSSAIQGPGCVDVDPDFLGSGDNPFDLSSSSPESVSKGGSTSVTGYVEYDFLNRDRDDTQPSMGAYEYQETGNDCTVGCSTPGFDSSASFVQHNASIAQTAAPSLAASFSGVQRNAGMVSANRTPDVTTQAILEDTLDTVLYVGCSTPGFSASASMTQVNGAYVSASVSAPTALFSGVQKNSAVITGLTPAVRGFFGDRKQRSNQRNMLPSIFWSRRK
jgi:hypothetical protein